MTDSSAWSHSRVSIGSISWCMLSLILTARYGVHSTEFSPQDLVKRRRILQSFAVGHDVAGSPNHRPSAIVAKCAGMEGRGSVPGPPSLATPAVGWLRRNRRGLRAGRWRALLGIHEFAFGCGIPGSAVEGLAARVPGGQQPQALAALQQDAPVGVPQ